MGEVYSGSLFIAPSKKHALLQRERVGRRERREGEGREREKREREKEERGRKKRREGERREREKRERESRQVKVLRTTPR